MTDPDEAGPDETKNRRRASRAAGPAGDTVEAATVQVPVPVPSRPAARAPRPLGPPPRRRPNARQTAVVAGSAGLAATIVLGGLVTALAVQHRHADATQRRDQRFVDTAVQTVLNMYTYTPDTIDEQVNRFVAGTSGPLRDTMAANAENLKAILRETKHSSEAVINAAALERIDDIAGNASVLVAMRATATDVDGVNKPSQPYALRLIVHEDDAGNMTAYDLKWPDGSS
ncbi:mammalian cell entry protein [[Mycobacterium] crassicus]|uniref:Mammalian cell entry protein n=1 Tax=[Mycobacterium] crassicus TaxID=2872309 RepID=A0ABU5XHS6_9MYCO|nr:mammalian cell entry protein [Mycolicibacter sp. MYC098]MEB3021751.1 mammalian cell entry protein [Mycolicibacter sp. MYC098]